MHRLRQEGQRRRLAQHHPAAEFVRVLRSDLAIALQELPRAFERMHNQPRQDCGPDFVQAEFERRHHAEIAAAAAYGPEQFCIFIRTGVFQFTGGRHDVGRDQVVHGHAVFPAQPPEAAAQCQAGHAGRRVDAEWGSESEGLCLLVELAKQDAGLDPRGLARGIDAHRFHRRQVQHQAAVAHRAARDVVTTPADGEQQTLRPRQTHAEEHIGGAGTAKDQTGAPVDHRIPDRARFIVAGIVRQQRCAAQAGTQFFERCRIQRMRSAATALYHGRHPLVSSGGSLCSVVMCADREAHSGSALRCRFPVFIRPSTLLGSPGAAEAVVEASVGIRGTLGEIQTGGGMADASLQLRLLGELQVLRDGKTLALPASRKTRALLAYLVADGWITPSRTPVRPAVGRSG